MRKPSLLFITAALLCACNQKIAQAPADPPFNEEKEKAAIMKTIEDETTSFYQRDYEAWKKDFVHSDYAFHAWNNDDGTFDAQMGWPRVDAKIGNYIKAHPLEAGETTRHSKVERRNMVTKFFNDSLAFLVWDEYASDEKTKKYFQSKSQRIMEKQNGEWKIASVVALWDYKNLVPADSLK
jgi:hypothetical protein